MLVALLHGKSIDAETARKGDNFSCPSCERSVILHKGLVKIAHFKHKNRSACDHGGYETEEHEILKRRFFSEWKKRGSLAILEGKIDGIDSSKRFPDVRIDSRNGRVYAVEIVHKNNNLKNMIAKNDWYYSNAIAPIWIFVVTGDLAARLSIKSQGLFLEKFTPNESQKWAHGLSMGELYLALSNGIVVCCKFEDHFLYKEGGEYYDQSQGELRESSGGLYRSKKFRNLKIIWKRGTGDIAIGSRLRDRFVTKNYVYPSGKIGRLVER